MDTTYVIGSAISLLALYRVFLPQTFLVSGVVL